MSDDDREWWCDEQWLVRSIRENWGLELLILFLVDLQRDAPRKKGHGVWAVAAVKEFPADRIEASRGVSQLRYQEVT